MRKVVVGFVVAVAALSAGVALCPSGRAVAAEPEKLIAHNVYFSLKDSSAENKKKLVESCKTYLAKLPGIVFFAAGTSSDEFNRPINDKEFDVGLHVVFKDKESYDKYEVSDPHKKFVAENKDNWQKVRVFDSRVEQ